MRRYNVVSGVLFILPIINFALAAPALVQEKRHAFVNVVHRPDVEITMLGKRVKDPLDLMWDKYFQNLWGKPEVSSATHAPSSSAPLAPGHGSTNVIQDPAPNFASSTANPGHALVEPASPSSEVGLDHEITEITEVHSPQSNPNLNINPSTNSDSDFDWDHWQNKEDTPPRPGSSTKPGVNWKYWINPLNLLSPLTPEATLSKSRPSTKWNTKPSTSSTKPGVNWRYWINPLNLLSPLTPEATLSKSRPSTKSNTKSTTSSPTGWNSFLKKWKNPLAKPSKSGQMNLGPSNPGSSSTKFAPRMPSQKSESLTTGSLKIPPSNIATQLSSADLPGADSQSLDLQAAAHASKGKAKA